MNKQITIDGNNYLLRQAVDGVYEIWVNDKFTHGYKSLYNIQRALINEMMSRTPLTLTVDNVMDYYTEVALFVNQFEQGLQNEI